MAERNSILVIGATGGIGGELARRLAAKGWKVRALHRDPAQAAAKWRGAPVEWVKGDAMAAADVRRAAEGVAVIFHGANPPGYRNWGGLVLPMLDNTIAAAKATGAMIAFPGTVYNFAPDTFPLVDESAPQRPMTRKGKIRVAMEARLQAASAAGTQVLIVRAGDFFGPNTANSWFGQALVKPGKPVGTIYHPGSAGAGHDWAYLSDLAETFARLLDRRDALAPFAMFHFRGHYFRDGIEMAQAVARVAGKGRVRRFPWIVAYAAAPFSETFRELLEMRYLWKETLELDNRKLVAFLGEEPHTDLDVAVGSTLAGLGCV